MWGRLLVGRAQGREGGTPAAGPPSGVDASAVPLAKLLPRVPHALFPLTPMIQPQHQDHPPRAGERVQLTGSGLASGRLRCAAWGMPSQLSRPPGWLRRSGPLLVALAGPAQCVLHQIAHVHIIPWSALSFNRWWPCSRWCAAFSPPAEVCETPVRRAWHLPKEFASQPPSATPSSACDSNR